MEEREEEPLTLYHLQVAIESQGKAIPKLSIGNAREICSIVQTLNLQFQGLGSLTLAWLLVNIEKLILSNNNLKSTRGLESLKNLKWLDLSFNKITSIDGLQELKNLQVLTLRRNCLQSLDKSVFSKLKNIEVLTLGSNFIRDREEVLMLRRLPKLGSLTLQGNPCCEEDYPSYVIALVPNLVYLDYLRITKQQREDAIEKHHDSLISVELENENIRKASSIQQQQQEEKASHKMAGVFALNDDSLFQALFQGDYEMEALKSQRGVQAIIDRFREQFKGICLHIFEAGLLHAEQRRKELSQVKIALEEARAQSDVINRIEVANLEKEMKNLFERVKEIAEDDELGSITEDQDAYEAKIQKAVELREDIEEKLDLSIMNLLENEVTLANQVKEVLELAEEELGSMVSVFLADAANYFEEGRGFAYSFYCLLREITSKLVESSAAINNRGNEVSSQQTQHIDKIKIERASHSVDECEQTLDEDIFEGSDTLTTALARIHDRHLDIISKRETELKDQLTSSWLIETLEQLYRLEWKRHRTRLEEITTLSEEKRKDLSDALPLDVFTFE